VSHPSVTTPPARPVIEDVRPRVDDGRYAAKAVVGDEVTVEADVFLDGHDLLAVEFGHRRAGTRRWRWAPMSPVGNDRWRGVFVPADLGGHQFLVRARVDRFATWLHDLRARLSAGQSTDVEWLVGAELVRAAAEQAGQRERKILLELAGELAAGSRPDLDVLHDGDVARLVARHGGDPLTTSEVYAVRADRPRGRFSTWYEMFPRSASVRPGRHGSLLDVVDRLDYIAGIGADVLYLPPIHPIGTTERKGRNGSERSKRGDVGSPWAIGSPDGGHTAVHPLLGTLDDFATLVGAAAGFGIEIALDLAFQCSPDHTWVSEHPDWFKHRPDGSIRYAENPPKRYQDVYPLDFDSADWRALWDALRDVVEFWVGHGVAIFRVDNPHTKPFPFWEWLIPAVQEQHPEVLFLAEAFTRPKVMKRLAKLGFTQSYTYFTWRNERWELEQYLTELTATDVADYFRPNFWPNTPDILSETLQHGNRATFAVRALLAGTLTASYGIYGPVFELAVRTPRHAGSEEYLDAEKYELRHFDLDDPSSLAGLLGRINAIRRDQLALQHDRTLVFHRCDNDQLIAYSKTAGGIAGAKDATAEGRAPIFVVANLDARHAQSGWVEVDVQELGIADDGPFAVTDLLSGTRFEWKGGPNFVILDPTVAPGHVFRIEGDAI
jgi:starch synthase (maltosyl-transferring)